MLLGGEDAITDERRCAEIADDLRAGGSQVETIVYAGAVHQWDGAFDRRPIGRNLRCCSLYVERDGTIRDATGLAMTGPLRKIILGLCTLVAGPYPIGRDDRGESPVECRLGPLSGQDFCRRPAPVPVKRWAGTHHWRLTLAGIPRFPDARMVDREHEQRTRSPPRFPDQRWREQMKSGERNPDVGAVADQRAERAQPRDLSADRRRLCRRPASRSARAPCRGCWARHLSPATIRNVMADLEEAGLLYLAAHLGRAAADRGRAAPLCRTACSRSATSAEDERHSIESLCAARGKSLPQALEEATTALSGLSHCAGLVVVPKQDRPLKHIEFVHSARAARWSCWSPRTGWSRTGSSRCRSACRPRRWSAAGNYLNARLVGRTIEEARTEIERRDRLAQGAARRIDLARRRDRARQLGRRRRATAR